MTQGSGRVACPKCGANNFETVATCYRCGTVLGAGRPGVQKSGVPMAPPPNVAPNLPNAQGIPAAPVTPAYIAQVPSGPDGDPGMARRAAVLLALTCPYLGLPIGWAFMMMEDQRRQKIGRFCANWSLIALIFHMLLMYVAVASLTAYLPAILTMSKQLAAPRNEPGGN